MVKKISWFGNAKADAVKLKASDGMDILKVGVGAGIGMLALGLGAAAFGAGMDAGFGGN